MYTNGITGVLFIIRWSPEIVEISDDFNRFSKFFSGANLQRTNHYAHKTSLLRLSTYRLARGGADRRTISPSKHVATSGRDAYREP